MNAKRTSSAERRKHIRAKRVLSIQYRIIKSRRKVPDKEWHLSTTYDMSLGGLSFYSDVELKKGETLEIKVVMSGLLDVYKGTAKVVRIEKKKTGAHFLVGIKLIAATSSRRAKSYSTKKKTK